jgi:competence protein ComFA
MKALLYAVLIHSKWRWHITLDIHTDMHYWFGRHGPDTGMLILDTPLSLGQAQRIRDHMSLDPLRKDLQLLKDHPTVLNRDFHSSTITASTKASLTALAQRIKLIAARCGMRSSIVEAVRLTPISYESWREGSENTDFQMDQSMYDQIVRALSGRSLLIEEIAQLLEHQGLDSESFSWQSYVQLAHLQGDLMITSGLVIEPYRDPKTFWKKSTAYRCRRCGSGNERMFWSPCVFCGENCPYCEECLTMGRT